MSDLKDKFLKFHAANPEVYVLFSRFAFQIINRGFEHYGAKSVMERMRWHTTIETTGSMFKLSNNHTAYYARMFEELNPKYKGFFRKKSVKADMEAL